MAEAGIKDIIVSNQIVTENKILRLLALTDISNITVPVDNPQNADLLFHDGSHVSWRYLSISTLGMPRQYSMLMIRSLLRMPSV